MFTRGFMLEKITYHQLAPEETEWISQASALINTYAQQGLMLEQPEEQLANLAEQGRFAVALNQNGQVIGTLGLTLAYTNGELEFGGWAVVEEYRHQGVGVELLKHFANQLDHLGILRPDQVIFALANNNSRPIFHKLQAEEVDQTQASLEIFEPCQNCLCDKSQLKPGHRCVDSMHLLTNVLISLAEASNP